jgi:hypothetical protein
VYRKLGNQRNLKVVVGVRGVKQMAGKTTKRRKKFEEIEV